MTIIEVTVKVEHSDLHTHKKKVARIIMSVEKRIIYHNLASVVVSVDLLNS